MTAGSDPRDVWLTWDAAATQLSVSRGRLRHLVQDHSLVSVRRDGVPVIYQGLIRDGQPLTHLRGTLIVLADAGFTDEQAMVWLLTPLDELDGTPLDSLWAGRRSAVRRVAQALAF